MLVDTWLFMQARTDVPEMTDTQTCGLQKTAGSPRAQKQTHRGVALAVAEQDGRARVGGRQLRRLGRQRQVPAHGHHACQLVRAAQRHDRCGASLSDMARNCRQGLAASRAGQALAAVTCSSIPTQMLRSMHQTWRNPVKQACPAAHTCSTMPLVPERPCPLHTQTSDRVTGMRQSGPHLHWPAYAHSKTVLSRRVGL